MITIPISSLKTERRDGTANFTYLDPETKEVRTEEIPISFLKPTEALWDELVAMEKGASAEGAGEDAQKGLFVKQLVRVQIQSTAITEDDGRPHNITEEDLSSLDFIQLAQLWEGIKQHFFLQTPVAKQETATSSSSALAAN
jgi:hypothetical protein